MVARSDGTLLARAHRGKVYNSAMRTIMSVTGLVLLGFGAFLLYSRGTTKTSVLEPHSMTYEIVRTPLEQERGLSGRSSIPDNYGMLFVFAKADRYGFWMKDMLVPIDIIWLSDFGTIIKVDASVAPSTYPNAFYPPEPVHYVLETRAGYAATRGWTAGSVVPLPQEAAF